MFNGGFIQVFCHEMTGKQRLILLLLLAFMIGVTSFSFYKKNEKRIGERNKALKEILLK